MYAIVTIGGGQHRVSPGDTLDVALADGVKERALVFDKVLLVADGDAVRVGQPYVGGARVRCAVLDRRLGPKLIIYKYRRRKSSHVKRGHRQPLVRLKVEAIEG